MMVNNRTDRLDTDPSRPGGSSLARLDEMDGYEVADGEPDVRGWDVKLARGEEIGEVDELVVDPAAMEVRYLEVKVKHELLGTEDDQNLLIPIGAARLDDDQDVVFVDRLPSAGLPGAPRVGNAPLTAEHDRLSMAYFLGREGGTSSDDYDRFMGKRRAGRDRAAYITRSEERLAVGKRTVQQGEVAVRKSVETEHVSKKVPTKREDVTVERRNATPGTAATPQIGEDEIRIPLMGEEVVVDKRAVPVEELVVKKKVVDDTESIETDLKRERVDIDREKGAPGRDRRP